MRRWATIAGLLAVFLTAGCSLDGRGDLPFAAGTKGDAYHVTVYLADASNLVPHAEVKVNDITVGTIQSITMTDWRARLTLGVARSVVLPGDAVANVGQKSLLGAQYLQLAAPAKPSPAAASKPLAEGSVIPVERTGTYPNTEDLLIALSSFLNGSGLTQLKTVIQEMNVALDGRTDDIRGLLSHMQQVAGELSSQRKTVAQLIDRMNLLTRDLRAQAPKIDRALPALAPGLAALDAQRPALMRTLRSIDELDAVATPVLAQNRDQLVKEVRDLRPVLSRVADAGNDAADALNVAGTLIYPLNRVPTFIHGDYLNLFINFDARADTFDKTLFGDSEVWTEDHGTASTKAAPTMTQLLAPTTLRGRA